MRARSHSPLASTRHEAPTVDALLSWKRLSWWLQTVMKLWRVIRPQQDRRGTDSPKQGNVTEKCSTELGIQRRKINCPRTHANII